MFGHATFIKNRNSSNDVPNQSFLSHRKFSLTMESMSARKNPPTITNANDDHVTHSIDTTQPICRWFFICSFKI